MAAIPPFSPPSGRPRASMPSIFWRWHRAICPGSSAREPCSIWIRTCSDLVCRPDTLSWMTLGSRNVREIIGKFDNLRVANRLQYLGHRRVITVTRTGLIVAQGLGQVILTLTRQTRDIFLPGEIRPVADITSVLLGQGAALLHSPSLAGSGRRARRWQSGKKIGGRLQILITELFRHRIHRLGEAQTLAEHEQLDERIGRRLGPERGHFKGLRIGR